jgi:hypothetical protein
MSGRDEDMIAMFLSFLSQPCSKVHRPSLTSCVDPPA